jgi:NRAMP (natural resistance-associated macrophage protein)-like metal ion transporter
MAIVQEMCARLGLVTGRGLAANIRRHYPRWILLLCASLLFFANVFNIGANLGAMAKETQLLIPSIPFYSLVILFTIITLLMQIFINYSKYAKYLKYLALVLLAYIITVFAVKDFSWIEALRHGVMPSITFSKEQIFLICGILGTTVSPYLFFWQTSQEVEEEIAEGKVTLASRQGTDITAIKKMRLDVWSGMFLSNLVMFFIIAVCAATLYKQGITNIQTASDAAMALRPLAGDKAFWLFAIGIIGTGLLGVRF